MFALEMKCRKMLHELVAPLTEKMNKERQRMTLYNEKHQVLDERISQVEHIVGVPGIKPKVFEAI